MNNKETADGKKLDWLDVNKTINASEAINEIQENHQLGLKTG